MTAPKQTRICEHHLEYKTPMLYVDDQFMCPYCGNKGDVFHVGVDVMSNETIDERHRSFRALLDQSKLLKFEYPFFTRIELYLPF